MDGAARRRGAALPVGRRRRRAPPLRARDAAPRPAADLPLRAAALLARSPRRADRRRRNHITGDDPRKRRRTSREGDRHAERESDRGSIPQGRHHRAAQEAPGGGVRHRLRRRGSGHDLPGAGARLAVPHADCDVAEAAVRGRHRVPAAARGPRHDSIGSPTPSSPPCRRKPRCRRPLRRWSPRRLHCPRRRRRALSRRRGRFKRSSSSSSASCSSSSS